MGRDSAGAVAPHLSHVHELADVLIMAGDLTRYGTVEETKVFTGELEEVVASGLPVMAVLGNHDHHSNRAGEVASLLEEAGITVLEGEAFTVDVSGELLGVAGVKGFGGGFTGASGSDFGEAEMKEFMRHSRAAAEGLGQALAALEADHRVAVTHYSPVPDTLVGERLEIYPFLGSSYLAEAIDGAGADLALHGHAHNGTEQGVTPGGVPVRNVAQPVIRQAYRVYCLGEE